VRINYNSFAGFLPLLARKIIMEKQVGKYPSDGEKPSDG
jgi:hypothetical protein